jgi:hypothetical protein
VPPLPKLGDSADNDDPTKVDATPPPPPAPVRKQQSDLRALVLGRRPSPPRPTPRRGAAEAKKPPPLPAAPPVREVSISATELVDDTAVEIVPPFSVASMSVVPSPAEATPEAPAASSAPSKPDSLVFDEAFFRATARPPIVVFVRTAWFFVALATKALVRWTIDTAAPQARALAGQARDRLREEWSRASKRAKNG